VKKNYNDTFDVKMFDDPEIYLNRKDSILENYYKSIEEKNVKITDQEAAMYPKLTLIVQIHQFIYLIV